MRKIFGPKLEEVAGDWRKLFCVKGVHVHQTLLGSSNEGK
jgi:hypothetical protein